MSTKRSIFRLKNQDFKERFWQKLFPIKKLGRRHEVFRWRLDLNQDKKHDEILPEK